MNTKVKLPMPLSAALPALRQAVLSIPRRDGQRLRARCLLEMIAGCGLHGYNVTDLLTGDVDVDASVIHVRSRPYAMGMSKAREVPMTPECRKAILDLWRSYPSKAEEPLLWSNYSRSPNMLYRLCEEAEMERIRPEDLRAMWLLHASRMMDLETLNRVAGYANIYLLSERIRELRQIERSCDRKAA